MVLSCRMRLNHNRAYINVFIVCFTTACLGLEFYDLLYVLQECCLYHDTDSVTFVSHPGDWMPLLRDYLSNLPPDKYIMVFVSSGSKSYGCLQFRCKCCLKIITLNETKREKINSEALKGLMDYNRNPANDDLKSVVEPCSVIRNKQKWNAGTGSIQKMQKVV